MERKDIDELADLYADVFHNLVSQELYENGKRRPVYYRVWCPKENRDEVDVRVDEEQSYAN